MSVDLAQLLANIFGRSSARREALAFHSMRLTVAVPHWLYVQKVAASLLCLPLAAVLTLVAILLPASRAMRTDPMPALHCQ